MEELLSWIDGLIEDESLLWRRNNRQVRIALSQDGRSQIVRVARQRDRYVFSSVIVPVAEVIAAGEDMNRDRRALAFRLWRRNALKAIVTFTIDRRRRVIGLIDQPVESVRREELRFYLETLARECDRLEYILTGADKR